MAADRSGQILMGLPAIAAFLGISTRQARYLSSKGALPVFKLPRTALTCARPETLRKYIVEQEAAARAASGQD